MVNRINQGMRHCNYPNLRLFSGRRVDSTGVASLFYEFDSGTVLQKMTQIKSDIKSTCKIKLIFNQVLILNGGYI